MIESGDNDNVNNISPANKLNTGGIMNRDKDNTSSGRHSVDSGSSTDEEEADDNNGEQGEEEEEDSEDNQDKDEDEEEGEKNHTAEGVDNDDLSCDEQDDETEAQTGRTTRATESTSNKHLTNSDVHVTGNKEESRKLSTVGCGNKRKSSSPSKSIASVLPTKIFKGSGDMCKNGQKGKKKTIKTSGKTNRKQTTYNNSSNLNRGRSLASGVNQTNGGGGAMLSVPTSMVPPLNVIDGAMQQQQQQGGQQGGGGPQLTQAAFAAATAALATAAAAAGMPVNQLLSQVGVFHKCA